MNVEIPREQVAWSPTIDYGLCTADRACLDFCHNVVFRWNEVETRVEVVNPEKCVLGCTSCAQICPVEAISFPDKEELRKTLRRLRAEIRERQALSERNQS
jgi:NAD-dependent dihydropyrimidine dehydrogenase PreA subunit